MVQARITRDAIPVLGVQEDWLAWLPEDKDELFVATADELEISYVILSVALNDAFTLCRQGKLAPAREEAAIFADLFDRLSKRLRGVLRPLDEHSRRLTTMPNVVPLQAEFFRSEQAQQVARSNQLAFMVVFRARTRFVRKLDALEQVLVVLDEATRKIAARIADGSTVSLLEQWTRLEVLHYDLNTALREIMIVFKSFLCVLPDEQMMPFRKRLLSALPAMFPLRARRGARQQPSRKKISATQAPCVPAPQPCEPAPRRQRISGQSTINNKDNLGGKDRISSPRMRPDGTGGPNETN